MRKIIMITFAQEISKSTLATLKVSIEKFLQIYTTIFRDQFPKLHYLLHIAEDIKGIFNYLSLKFNLYIRKYRFVIINILNKFS